MLIIEGADLIGKTTFAHALVKRLNEDLTSDWPFIYSHFSRLPKKWNYFGDYLPFVTRYTVQDRFHMSEVIYGIICRGTTFISPERYRRIDAHLCLEGTMTVVITADEDLIRERWGQRDEMFNLEQVLRVNAAYAHLVSCRALDLEEHVMQPTVDVSRFLTVDQQREISHYRHAEWLHHYACHQNNPYPSSDVEFVDAVARQFLLRLKELYMDERTVRQ